MEPEWGLGNYKGCASTVWPGVSYLMSLSCPGLSAEEKGLVLPQLRTQAELLPAILWPQLEVAWPLGNHSR